MKTIVNNSKVYGTNAERLAMNVPTDSDIEISFYETDTNAEYLWKGSEWVQISTNGAACVRTIASDVAPPESDYLEFAPAVTASGTSATAYISGDVSKYNHMEFEVYQISGTTPVVTVLPTYDGTNFSVTPMALVSMTTGAVVAGATGVIAVGNYAVFSPGKARGYKIMYAAAVAGTVTLRGAHSVV